MAERSDETGSRLAGPEPGLVLSVSLLAGALATYPQAEGLVSGSISMVRGVTWFVTATTIALIGLSIVARLFYSFASANSASATAGATDPAAPLTAVQLQGIAADLGVQAVDHGTAIADALAPTDALVHQAATAS